MPHNGARDRQCLAPCLGCQVGAGEGVMVRRLSLASPDSGAESSVYGGEPADGSGRGDRPSGPSRGGHLATHLRQTAVRAAIPASWLGAPPIAAGRRLVGSAQSAWLPAPSSAAPPSVYQPGSDPAAKAERVSQLLSFCHVSGDQASQSARSCIASRLRATGDMSVVDQQNGRWYVKDIRASHAADGDLMTWFASSMTARHGGRLPRKRTDVHGREG